MRNEKYQKLVEKLLDLADVKINGSRDWDIQVHNNKFYKRVITEAELGLGESYMDGWWDAEKIDELIYKIIRAELQYKIKHNYKIYA